MVGLASSLASILQSYCMYFASTHCKLLEKCKNNADYTLYANLIMLKHHGAKVVFQGCQPTLGLGIRNDTTLAQSNSDHGEMYS